MIHRGRLQIGKQWLVVTAFALSACGSSSAPVEIASGGDPGGAPAVCTSSEALAQHPLDLLPVLSYPVPRGGLVRCIAPAQTPSAKTADGRIEDWIGQPSAIGGTTRLDAGESIHTDFLFDAYGADDGRDAQRLTLLNPLAAIDARIGRFDALLQAAGDQLGVPEPIGARDHYGNTTGLADEADLAEVRWAVQGQSVFLLARWTTLTDPARAALLVLLDTQTDDGGAREVGFASGLRTQRFDRALLLSADGVRLRERDSEEESVPAAARVTVNAEGWTNALEAELPASLFATQTAVAVVALRRNEDGGVTPANVAYRSNEPVTIYGERLQALALAQGTVDDFHQTLDLDALRRGASETVFPGAGYHERQFRSADNISREEGENGRWQPYGLFMPSAYLPPPAAMPLDLWLHYRGGKAHSGAAWTPRLINELGERPGHVVVTPRGRGTSTWYVTQAHQDVFEVLADMQVLVPNLDPQRRYLSGYSMGGYGTYLFGLLYPDQFSAGYSTSGAVTQGAWTGLGPDDFTCGLPGGTVPGVGELENPCFVEANEGDASAQLMFRLLENARHFPITIHHGGNDQLALTPGALRMGLRMTELGYRHDMTIFAGYEHFTQAIVDEWADGVAYMHQFRTPAAPRRITYTVSPALTRALNTIRANDVSFDFRPDGAWWVDDLVVRDPNPDDPAQLGRIDAESFALAETQHLPVPRVLEVRADAVSTPVLSVGAHSTPYVRTGLDWLVLGERALSNGFSVDLERLRAATLDVTKMGLDLSQPVDGDITTDGEVQLQLTGLRSAPAVTLNDQPLPVSVEEGRLRLTLPAGTHRLRLAPQ